MSSFEDFKGTLPYSSELFGIYQPLLGWKSQIILKRYERIRASLYNKLAARALNTARTHVKVHMRDMGSEVVASRTGNWSFSVSNLVPLDLERALEPFVASTIDSGVARMIQSEAGKQPPEDWGKVITTRHVKELLKQFHDIVSNPEELQKRDELSDYVAEFSKAYTQTETQNLLEDLFARESKIAGYLLFLKDHTPSTLNDLFFKSPSSALVTTVQLEDPLLNFGATNYEAILSPLGVMQLYRQYFFQFDSFLGPPVGHVWLSPGGTVELIEVSTRRTLTEKTFEQSLETTTKSETDTTIQDDIADAVKQENRDNTKFGFSSTGEYNAAVYSGSATAELSMDMMTARSNETTRKHMRQQSEKLSSEIKRNFKSFFRTTTEREEMSSKRYVLANTTNKLVNYELRRKMQTVGVQVQRLEVRACWHTFVDDAARELGIAKLVHIGEPPELSGLVQPDAPQIPTAQLQEVSIAVPFVGINTDDTDNIYVDGTERDIAPAFDAVEYIQADFVQRVTFQTPGFTLTGVDIDPQGVDAILSVRDLQSADGSSAATFTIHLDYVNWNGRNQIPTKVTLHWDPSNTMRTAVTAEYESRMAQYNIEKARRYKEAFYAAARERIKLASAITPRPAEDLREEERVVVFRTLIGQLMSVGTNQSKHVISELVRSIFDVDKMLYFVAPEWWAPRLHRSGQDLGEEPPTKPGAKPTFPSAVGVAVRREAARMRLARAFSDVTVNVSGLVSTLVSTSDTAVAGNSITSENIVDWGGAKELGRDNYYITEDSRPAKLGASLGWLLQLDGDNLRNAFLNAPWVKAVIPIRIGKEREALNWLQQAHVEGAEGLDAQYIASPDDPPELISTPEHTVTIRDALDFLIEKIQEFDTNARTPVIGNPADPTDASNHFAGSLPTEAVFEHGFYPLEGGVQVFEGGTSQSIFAQWMEILPTDQVAAMEVEYDPKTLRVRGVNEE
ncbi:hypothetical protein FHT86_001415 [Rhizobium sp. BK313]|uniref:hypothetical protein n=1 Tax=Rhizobium sp. BK313 TaxID=2587081 RepID=UPI00105C4691|nr:hypothetical protein [Rhizobium sp. BK313]MBB3453159.1 hypothetical protein [Rhizobium sp. BK313]